MSDDTKPVLKEVISELSTEVLFNPGLSHQAMKAQFWSRYPSTGLLDPRNLTLPDVQQYVSDPRIKKHWSTPGFREWFLNQDENRERQEYLYMKALDAAEEILLDPNANANAKVQLIKLLAELTNRMPKNKSEEKFSDEQINKLSADELKTWLKRKGVTVKAQYEVRPGTSRAGDEGDSTAFIDVPARDSSGDSF